VKTPLRKVRRSRNVALVALAIAIVNLSCWGQTRTLAFKTTDDVDTVSFDPTKISEAKLRQLILLSPVIVSYFNDLPNRDLSAAGSRQGDNLDKVFLALPLELCIASDRAYSHCEENDIGGPNFLHNAKVNLEKAREGLKWLQNLDYPMELQPAVKFLLDRLALSLWVEETRFKYYSTWNESVLKAAHHGIDPLQICPATFRKLEAATSDEEKYRIVRFDWANCMIKAIDHQMGWYPINSWNAFLQSYGITEHYEQTGPD
jgi:hypothetical protein